MGPNSQKKMDPGSSHFKEMSIDHQVAAASSERWTFTKKRLQPQERHDNDQIRILVIWISEIKLNNFYH